MNTDLVEQLFSRYYNDALLYAMSLTKNAYEAEDIAQDAFYKALKTADGALDLFRQLYFRQVPLAFSAFALN